MATPIDELYEKAAALPLEERTVLTGLLVDTLQGTIDPDIESAWRAEIAKRVTELDSGKARTVSWEQVREKLLQICGTT